MAQHRNLLALVLAFVVGGLVAPVAVQYTARVAHAAPATPAAPTAATVPAAQEVRPASPAAASVRKWEQFCSPHLDGSHFAGANDVTGALNSELKIRGQEGWELVGLMPLIGGNEVTRVGSGIGLTGVVACFRRPVP